ncbi:hypothetical protein [Propionivibrio dicarboxylicus]|uniref:Uncharacterized protein n=1 Tax=Propionivibrio dicarboxylicus TaxID=83767 RepID=A0A1G8C8R0_9RHOO|nr:hypothetical protein [Propionivibrio dicarboxylicus]SDH41689.1 hypothetical protein SAMN05660652_01703 [Propionivibrio dicarboxylicus]
MANKVHPQLAAFEAAARLYCTKAGVDPDDGVQVPHPLGIDVPHFVPRWHIEADRLVDLSRMLSAMRDVARAQPTIVVPS